MVAIEPESDPEVKFFGSACLPLPPEAFVRRERHRRLVAPPCGFVAGLSVDGSITGDSEPCMRFHHCASAHTRAERPDNSGEQFVL